MTARLLPLGALTALALALPASAADPASGTLSSSAPKTQWTGEAAGYGTSSVADINGQFVEPCSAPNCDVFNLELKDAGDLSVTLTSDVGSFMTMEVEAPDGTITYNGGAEDSASTTIKLKKAGAGAYVVRAQTNNTLADDYGYSGAATLGSAPLPAPIIAPGTVAAPTATPAPAAQIVVRTRSGSARKVRKGLGVALSASAEVRGVVAELRKGRTVWARGSLAKLAGKRTLKLKGARKLKPGGYKLFVRGADAASGATVATTVKFKLQR